MAGLYFFFIFVFFFRRNGAYFLTLLRLPWYSTCVLGASHFRHHTTMKYVLPRTVFFKVSASKINSIIINISFTIFFSLLFSFFFVCAVLLKHRNEILNQQPCIFHRWLYVRRIMNSPYAYVRYKTITKSQEPWSNTQPSCLLTKPCKKKWKKKINSKYFCR